MAKKCLICERRPARDGDYCHNCTAKIEAEKRKHKSRQAVKYLTYRGYVVGLYRTGNGTLRPQLETRDPEKLPRSRTLDLNQYIPGFTRDQIKKFKACVLKLAHA